MSTTIKRVALVAVAALSLGVISVAPSSAAPTAAYGTLIGDSTLGQQEIGGYATIVISYNETITNVSTSGVGSIASAVVTTGDIAAANTALTVTNGSFTINDLDAATDTGTVTVTLYSTAVGVQTLTMTPFTATGQAGTAVTKTITWVTTLSANTYDHSYAYISADTTTAASVVLAADTNTASSATPTLPTFSAALNTAQAKAYVWVKQFSAADTSTVSTLNTGKGKEVVVEITGAGSLGATSGAASGSVLTTLATASGSSAVQYFVFSDGRSGTGTITVKVGGTLIATKTVKFAGTRTSIGADTGDNALSKNYIGASETASVTINEYDNNGTKIGAVASGLTVTTDTATIATATVSAGVVTITGVGVGTTYVNVTDGTYKTKFPVTVTKKTGTAVLTLDKSSYQAGEKVTWTITAKDANGAPVADGSRVFFSAFSSNMAVNGSLPDTTTALVDGAATGSFFAPSAGSGDFTITATLGAAQDEYISALAAATLAGTTFTAPKVTTTASIVNAGVDAATDAANEAAQAASDATDAALAAADAADAATTKAQEAVDAVATLSAQVSKLITALKAQITTLTNLVIKIQKKVKA